MIQILDVFFFSFHFIYNNREYMSFKFDVTSYCFSCNEVSRAVKHVTFNLRQKSLNLTGWNSDI